MRITDRLLNIIYPLHCPYCNKIIKYNQTECNDCGEKMYVTSFKHKINDDIICYSPFKYNGDVRTALHKYKFQGHKEYCRSFGKALYNITEINNLQFDIITSVPLSPARKKLRRYNQSQLVAQELSSFCGIKYQETLVKIKENKEQHSLKRQERENNVKGVYGILNCNIANKNILLCDDIVTTGNTLAECARVLLKFGANNVICITIATVE